VVRNTRGVTGFVGPGSEPVPLTDQEMLMFGVKSEEYTIDVEEGDEVRVISGAWEGTVAVVKDVNAGKQTVTIEMDIFGRGTDVEISLSDIVKL
jgi:transcriptional antiterminator NusG